LEASAVICDIQVVVDFSLTSRGSAAPPATAPAEVSVCRGGTISVIN